MVDRQFCSAHALGRRGHGGRHARRRVGLSARSDRAGGLLAGCDLGCRDDRRHGLADPDWGTVPHLAGPRREAGGALRQAQRRARLARIPGAGRGLCARAPDRHHPRSRRLLRPSRRGPVGPHGRSPQRDRGHAQPLRAGRHARRSGRRVRPDQGADSKTLQIAVVREGDAVHRGARL